ncbi:hypothetical protein KIN20_002885 [Parelaphostrongylus tenuis]|uniref:Uncharacterized protein n=1 Tax=Parelaphostrongylus tenuis TaxID=148309 RepID=A0AAD5QI55_PARTN|nr:hypothetical protein KIN20_002885 [Parelaphostrongylus tenuis]
MARLSTDFIMISLLVTVSTLTGCGVMPAGQASNRTFTVKGFTTLPVAMVYTNTANSAKVSGIATSKAAAKAFVERLVMQTVIDVLESHGRSALLADFVISSILVQLEVRVTYEPLNCEDLILTLADQTMLEINRGYCIIADNTVTGICTTTMKMMCMPASDKVKVTGVNDPHLTISGTLSTSNIIMANWSKAMWENVVNRAVRMLASGPFGSHFFTAQATVGGN